MKLSADAMNMIKRTLSAFVIGWICFGCFVFGGLPLLILIGVISTIGNFEYTKILNNKGFYPFKTVMSIIGLLILTAASLKLWNFIPFIIYLGTAFSFMSVIFRGRQPYIGNVATTALGFLYTGWLPAHMILLRQIDSSTLGFLNFETNNGIVYLLMYFFGVLATDVGGFYFGKNLGKRKLAPVISPNKTVEGAIGGGISSIIVCLSIGWFTGLSIIHTIMIALVTTVFAQIGDLSESLMKRDAGVKDSGVSIPGHGGFLDRVDGYIFAAPAVYYYINYFVIRNDYGFIKQILELFNVAV
ncbi:phosphatidate cytidylyltransferase [bacterium]|nr:phosphatidate cytidylyltransferase [bacterium]